MSAPEKFYAQHDCDRNAEDCSFERPGIGKNRDSRSKRQSASELWSAKDSRQSAHDQRAANRCYRAAPVGIHPVAENPKLQERQRSAKESPFWREPTLQHPQKSAEH